MELIICLIILGILFVIACVVGIIRWNTRRITTWFAIKKLDINKPIEEYTNLLLEEHGLIDVQVKKVGFFASMFVGNTYSVKKKTIRLSWYASKRATATTLAQACRLVGLAKMHNDGVKGLKSIEMYRWLSWLPVLLLPLAIIGLIVDLIAQPQIGLYTLIFSGVGLVLTLFTFILACIASSKDIKACNEGEKIILGIGILNEQEETKIKKLFKAWKQLTIVNVLYNTFIMLFFLIRAIFSSFKLFGRK